MKMNAMSAMRLLEAIQLSPQQTFCFQTGIISLSWMLEENIINDETFNECLNQVITRAKNYNN